MGKFPRQVLHTYEFTTFSPLKCASSKVLLNLMSSKTCNMPLSHNIYFPHAASVWQCACISIVRTAFEGEILFFTVFTLICIQTFRTQDFCRQVMDSFKCLSITRQHIKPSNTIKTKKKSGKLNRPGRQAGLTSQFIYNSPSFEILREGELQHYLAEASGFLQKLFITRQGRSVKTYFGDRCINAA